jgi:hypothetical protein
MSQHDYTIANQGFPATRADINNALSAIATNNSGTTAPSYTICWSILDRHNFFNLDFIYA